MKYLNEQEGKLVEITFNDADSSSDVLFSKTRRGENIDPSKLTLCGQLTTIKVDNNSKSAINKLQMLRNELVRRIQKFRYTNDNPDYIVVSDLEIFMKDNIVLYYIPIHGVKRIKPKK